MMEEVERKQTSIFEIKTINVKFQKKSDNYIKKSDQQIPDPIENK